MTWGQQQLESTEEDTGTSLVGRWLRLCIPSAGGQGSVPGQGTRSHMPQLRVLCCNYRPRMLKLSPGAAK